LASYLAFLLIISFTFLSVCSWLFISPKVGCAQIEAKPFLSLACFFTFYLTFVADAKQARDRKGDNQQRRLAAPR
jgi:hypothetical protein